MKQKPPQQPQPPRRWVINTTMAVMILILAVTFFGPKPKPTDLTPPPQAAKAEVAKTEPAVGGELGKVLDTTEAALVAGDKALTAPVAEKPVGIIIRDSGAKISMDPVSSRPSTFLTEAQVRQMQEDAKARQRARKQKPISPPEK